MRRPRTLSNALFNTPTMPAPVQPTQAVVAVRPEAASALNDSAVAARRIIAYGVEIIDLLPQEPPYWGELAQADLVVALEEAEAGAAIGDALSAALNKSGRESLSNYIFDVEGRSAWMAVCGDPRGAVAMDVGAGYGANTIALSRRFDTVIATDMVIERLAVIGLRCRALGISNVILVRTSFDRNPLRKKAADLIVCNGVLEWVGSDRRKGSVDAQQQEVLDSLSRSLADDGQLYIGIENRYGLAAWTGARDHSGLRWTSLMPRTLAHIITKLSRQLGPADGAGGYIATCGYRTYTHSPRVWRRKLLAAGFVNTQFWGTNDYNAPQMAYPLGDRRTLAALKSMRRNSPRGRLVSNLIARWSWKLPSCLLIRASASALPDIPGTEGATPLLADLRSRGSRVTRYVFGGSPMRVMSAIAEPEARSPRRVEISGDGSVSETIEERTTLDGVAYTMEDLRDPATLAHAIPPRRGWESKAMRNFATWGPYLLEHLTLSEREWTPEDTERLVADPALRLGLTREWVDGIASQLEGKRFRFGSPHGDLTPENVFPTAGGVCVEDWNDGIYDAPVALDACFYAWVVAAKRGTSASKCLKRLRKALPKAEFEARTALLAVAAINWRSASRHPERVQAALRLAA